MKTNQMIAIEVLMGKWGNGDSRKKALRDAGYNPSAIQSIVNALVADGAFPGEAGKQETKLDIKGTETLEVEIDLNKYNSLAINFVTGGE